MEIKLGDIKKDNLEDIMPRLLQLEGNWEGIGEAPWTKDNFRLELPGKWKLSIYASYKNEIVGYMVCSISDKVGKINKIVVENGFRKKDYLWENGFLNLKMNYPPKNIAKKKTRKMWLMK